MQPGGSASALLTIDLDAIATNWKRLNARLAGKAQAAAVVKADAYGLGVAEVAAALHSEGCSDFFVASLDEGVELRAILPDARIAVFFGPAGTDEDVFLRHSLVPVLNDLGQIEAWSALGRETEEPGEAMIHVDTGMSRLGMPPDEVQRLAAEPNRLNGVDVTCVLSHLACAEQANNDKNAEQRTRFDAALGQLGGLVNNPRASLANSSGIFLGAQYHYDMVRPGAAIYGLNPAPDAPNPMVEVVKLQGKILQTRLVDRPETVGYGAAHVVRRPSRIATVPVGYADGYLRSASNHASCYIGGVRVPVVGRVSMDMITLDVTDLPEQAVRPGSTVDIIGGSYSVDALAGDAGTIGYEILTSLGHRYRREYVARQAGEAS